MLLRSVTFENFGIYGGVHTFDLTPASTDAFERPVVLFSGKNGVGKTTFVEGIRLCLHGALAVGSRVGQQELRPTWSSASIAPPHTMRRRTQRRPPSNSASTSPAPVYGSHTACAGSGL
jgi:hypothetical protein